MICSVNKCSKVHTAKTYCDMHYRKWRKYGDATQSVNDKLSGMYMSTEYKTWYAMKSRCNNPKVINYKYYGARGIKVCTSWSSFNNFINDMGRKPSPKHTLDRIDNKGNYEPDNCRWATKKEQANNRG